MSAEEGEGVLSFDPEGRERLIEVKTTNGSSRPPFFLTRNERDLSAERPEDWGIYRVYVFAITPRIFTISPPLQNPVRIAPETWRTFF